MKGERRLVSCLCLNTDLKGEAFEMAILIVRIIAFDKSCHE